MIVFVVWYTDRTYSACGIAGIFKKEDDAKKEVKVKLQDIPHSVTVEKEKTIYFNRHLLYEIQRWSLQ